MAKKHRALDLSEIQKKDLSEASGISPAGICRMLSHNSKQRRSNPTYETLRKLQSGLFFLTRRRYSLDEITAAITAECERAVPVIDRRQKE